MILGAATETCLRHAKPAPWSSKMSSLTTQDESDLARLSKMVLAGEDPVELADIIRALSVDLLPQSYLEHRQVEFIAQTDFEINRTRRRVSEIKRHTMDEIYRRDHAREDQFAAMRGEKVQPKNISAAAAYLKGEEAFRYLATQIWRLERARVLHIEQFEKLVRVRRTPRSSRSEAAPEDCAEARRHCDPQRG